MKNKADKEINKFLKTFDARNSVPSTAFKKKLEKQVKKEYSGRRGFLPYFQILLPVFLIVFIFVISQSGFRFGTQNETQQFAINDNQKREIFAKLEATEVLPKIEESISEGDIAGLSDISFNESEEKTMLKASRITLMSYPVSFPDDPILSVTEKITQGEKFDTCETLTQRYKGVEEINSYYFKAGEDEVLKVEEKVLIEDSILGEKFPDSYPASYPLSYALDRGLDILGGEIEGEERFFILKIDQDISGCDENIIFTVKMNEDTLQIKEIESYKDEITPENLIFKSEFI